MSMPQTARYWTPAMVRGSRPANRHWPRYECVDGELLLTPAPSLHHNEIICRLVTRLRAALEGRPGLCALFAPIDFELGRSLVQPDAFVVSYSGPDLPMTTHEIDGILLTIEVISRGSARNDRILKRQLYLREQVEEYWVVDLGARRIERWRAGETELRMETGEFVWYPSLDCQPIHINVLEMMGGLLG
jgi:Uma2 family endonuclease